MQYKNRRRNIDPALYNRNRLKEKPFPAKRNVPRNSTQIRIRAHANRFNPQRTTAVSPIPLQIDARESGPMHVANEPELEVVSLISFYSFLITT